MRTTSRRIALALLLALAVLPARADAAKKKAAAAADKADDADESSDPEVKLPPVLLKALHEKEAEVTAARREAIGLLESYLRDSPHSKEQAEALYKLAELYWEESKAVYIEKMGKYQDAVAACHADRANCPNVPRKTPTVDLSQAQAVYLRLINNYPKFRKIDTVIYLYAFSLRDQGKVGESIKFFQTILDKYPRSRYIADAWMAIAEYRFYEQQNYKSSLEAYEKVLQHPKSQLYDLALFKTAWCYWKLGDTNKSALRFKDVLDLAKKKAGRTEEQQKRAAELQGQALDYLVELFTEDDTKSAHDAFEFLAQIGGKQYSRKVLKQLADTVFDQTRYERAVEAYRLLIELDPNSAEAPDYHGKIVESYQLLGDVNSAVAEMRKLAANYGGRSAWATANKDRPKSVEHARTLAEGLIRNLAKTIHAEAQQNEKTTKVVDKVRYARAAEAYEFYLANFPDAADAVELRYLRADILYFKLGKYEEAGREYLTVGKTQPVGKFHKDALLQAMGAFEKVRKPGKREIGESDRLFGEAADIYATLFPKDKEIVTVIYKNGQFFFDFGDYDEAVKRFGLIVERYPDDPNAGPAGDRILQALNKAKNYENIEAWARRLKKTKAFSSKDEQQRLDTLIVNSVMKSGEKYASDGNYDKAAAFYLRVPHEYPGNGLAPKALNNAGAVLEKAKKQDEAVAAYKELADKYPSATEAPDALFTAARIEENVAYYDKAAVFYEQLAQRYPQNPHAADALRSAGVLRQSLGQHDKAIKHYGEYAKRYKDKSDAKQVAFQAAVVREDQKDWRNAAAAFSAYAKTYAGDARTVEAHAREADAQLKAGNDAAAKDAAAKALSAFNGGGKHHKATESAEDSNYWAAEARYIQGELVFHDYERIKIAGKPRQLAKVLEEKAKRLEEAKNIYLDVVTYKSPEWATAGLLRIGQGYEAYAKAMRNAPVPKDLNADEKQMYRDELEKVVVVIEDKSLDAYKTGYAKALTIGVYNKHTQAIRQALSRLAENEYPKEGSTALKRCDVISRPAPHPNPLPASRGEGTRSRTTKSHPLPLAGEGRGEGKPLWIALAVALIAAGCGHGGAKAPGAAANPIAPVVLPKTNAEAQAAFDEGVRLMKLGKKHYKEARKPLQRATELDGRLFEAWHDLGVIETSLGNFDKAVDDFERALSIQPGARKTLLAYGESLRRAHRPKKAASVYAKWLDADPNDFDMRARYGQVLREAGALDESLEQARLLLGNAGENVSHTVIAYNALALTYYKMSKYELAETALKKASDLDPKSAFVWNNLGLVAFERGHDQEAFLDFQKASELDPKYVQARLNKAVVYLDCGDYKKARTELERAVEIDPNDADAQVALGVAARGDGKFDLARKAYERALDIEPDYPPALYNLGVLYMDFDKVPAKAKDYLTQYTQSVGNDDPKRADAVSRLKELK